MTRSSFFAIVVLMLISVLTASAQQKVTVKVAVKDSLSKEPVGFATVYVSKDGSRDGALFAMADENGVGRIPKVSAGKYYVVAEFTGYYKKSKQINVDGTAKEFNAGTLYMRENVEMLDEVVVSAVGNPIIVKRDTIEYAATSIKTTDNDMLEDLLKKMQGFEVDSDGNITYNGEAISKIMLGGKEFFLDDPTLASKNIPANIINKVKVVNKKSDQAEFTGIDDGEETKVIDLSVKPGMFEAWFGNLTAGGGHDLAESEHDARYQASGMLGRYTEDSQISIILNGNNTNNRGFNDMNSTISGGMGRGGFGYGFGGGGGITTSWMAGVNGYWNLYGSKDKKLGGNYMYSGMERDVEESSARTTFLKDGTSLLSDNKNTSAYFSDNHRAGIEFDYKFNDKTSLLFRPRFTYGNSRNQENSEYVTENSATGKVNDGNSSSTSEGTTWRAMGNILLRQKLGSADTKRTLSLNIDYNLSNNDFTGANKSVTNNYVEGSPTDTSKVDQRYSQTKDSYSVSADLTYTEPLGKNFFLLGSYRFNWSQNNSEKLTYDRETGLLDSTYSNHTENTYLNHRIQVSFMKQEEKYNLQIGFNAQPSTTRTISTLGLSRDTTYTIWNFAPSARFDYRFSDSNTLRIFYNGRSNAPTINQLMPIPDNTNPLRVTLGNTALKPEFTHRMRFDYRYTDKETFSTYSVMGGFNYTKDDIVNASWYDETGVQYSAPINSTRPTLGGNLMLMMNFQFGKSGFSLSSFTRSSVSSGLSLTGNTISATELAGAMDSLISNRTTSLSVMENLTFVYRNKNLEARLGGRASYNKAWYEIATRAKSDTWNNSVFAEVTYTMPWGMEIRTDARYNFYIGYEEGYGRPTTTWNAEISQMFLKNKMTLRFKVYDILNQSRNNYHTTTENYIEDVRNNTLGQYFMISLTYRFGNNDKMKSPMRPGGGPGMGPRRM